MQGIQGQIPDPNRLTATGSTSRQRPRGNLKAHRCEIRFFRYRIKGETSFVPYRAQRTDHIGYSERLNALYDRLRAAGLPVESSRLHSYRQTLPTNKLLISENRSADLQTQIPIPTII